MTALVDLMQMRLYGLLRRRGLNDALIVKVCVIAVEQRTRSVESWTSMSRSHMITIGLSSEESLLVREALLQVGPPLNIKAVRADLAAHNAGVADGSVVGLAIK